MVCPLLEADQNRLLSLLPTPHVQIEDDLLNGGPCPTLRSCKSSSCVKACHTNLLCLLMMLLVLKFLPQPYQTNTWSLYCQILCWLGVGRDLKALSQTLQG